MKKFRKSLVILGLAATAICGLGFAAKAAVKEAVPTFATYTNHDADTYYSDISDDLTGTSLLSALQSLNSSKRKTTVGYSGMGVDPSGQFKYTDYDPDSVIYDSNGQPYGTKLTTFYSGNSATSGMNREHVWPKSHGGNLVENDIHMPRPTLKAENGSRGNSFYVEGKCHSSNGWDPAMESFGVESYRGDSARIIFYCVVANSNLSLLEADSHSTSNSNRDNLMGKLSDLIKWHLKYPVLQREQNRNEGAEYLQGNRNPFIDHRSYACKIWGTSNDTTKSLCDQYNGWTDEESTETKELVSLTFAGTPKKTTYVAGESFDPTGLTVTASYDDESSEVVTNSVKWGTLNVGDTSITGSYTYNKVTKSVSVTGITVSTPIEKTLTQLSVSGTLTKSVYDVGDAFNMNGLTVTAKFSDGSTSNVTNLVTFTPNTIQANTTKVTFSYTYEGVTKTVDFTNFTVKSSTFYGTEDNPLTPTQAMAIIQNECQTKGTFTTEQIYCRATISSFESKDTENNRLKRVVVSDGTTEVLIFTLNMDASAINTVTNGDEILFHGYGANYNGTFEFTYKNLTEGGSADVIFDKFYDKVIPVTSVTFGEIDTNVYTGDVVTLPVIVLPATATDKSLLFSSSDESVATVDANGVVTFLKAGTVTLTAKSATVITKSSQLTFSVQSRYVPVETISVSPANLSVKTGTNQQLIVVVSPVAATNKEVTYSSSNTSIATVSNSGLVTFLKSGEVNITVNGADSKSAVAHFVVSDVVVIVDVEQIVVPDSLSIEVGETIAINYQVLPENATDKTVIWSSSNSTVATVSSSGVGVVTGKQAGSTTIIARTPDGNVSAQCQMTVRQPSVIVEVEQIIIPSSLSIEVGETKAIEAQVLPENATDKTIVWSSSNEQVVTVSNSGSVIGAKAGTAIVTASTPDGEVYDTCEITVSQPSVVVEVESINALATLSLKVDETKQVGYEVLPENATDKSVVWASSIEDVATVSKSGRVTGIKAGTATITVSTPDGRVHSDCVVTVTDDVDPIESTLVEIVVANNPNKTVYQIDEAYDDEGLVIEAHYLDGTRVNVTEQCVSRFPDTSTAGTKSVKYTYDDSHYVFVKIEVLEDEVTELNIVKNPLKLNYYVNEAFNPLGLKVEAKIGNKFKDVTTMVEFEYNFSESNVVKVKFGGLEKEIRVVIEFGTITFEHIAVDFTYVFQDELGAVEVTEVKIESWKILEYHYNSLDADIRAILQSVVTVYGNGEVSAEDGATEKLKECISKYDEIYLAHKDEGFTDFMRRSPKAPTPTPEPEEAGLNPAIVAGIVGGVVLLIVAIIIIGVSASKKGKKKHA